MRTANDSYYIAVFEAAHRIVLRSGCGAATMRAVALEGGLSPSTVRSHYGTQSHLLACSFAAVEDHFARELSRTSHLLDRRADVRVEDAVQVLAVHLPTDGDGLDQLRQARLLRALVTGLAEEIVTVCEPPEGERSLGLPDRLMEPGVRAVLVQHLRAVVDLTSSGQEEQRRAAPPVDRAG
jgi:AcrR family transcriptional regulator